MGWQIYRDATRRRLVAAFAGQLEGDEGEASAIVFVTELDRGAAEIVWDVRAMTGYSPKARRAWQTALWSRKGQLPPVALVGGSRIVRMGAQVMAMILELRLECHEALDGLRPPPSAQRDSREGSAPG